MTEPALRICAAIIACAALAGCSFSGPPPIECVNIASHEKLTDTNQGSPDEPFDFTGTDYQGFRRYISAGDRKWWKCRREGAGE